MSIDLIKKLRKLIINGYRGAGIIYVYGDEVLMQLRRHPPVWSFVGGGFDPGKDRDYKDTAIREFFEETGLLIDKNRLPAKPLHSLGFWKYRWEIYTYISDKKDAVKGGSCEYAFEYEKYRYFNIYNYRNEVKNEQHQKFFFFVPHQMRKLIRMIEK